MDPGGAEEECVEMDTPPGDDATIESRVMVLVALEGVGVVLEVSKVPVVVLALVFNGETV